MAFTQVSLTGTYKTPTGDPASGSVTFTPDVPMRNGNMVIESSVQGDLNNVGTFTVSLAATTDAATVPAGIKYNVVEYITNQPTRSYSIEIPHSEGPLNLSARPRTGEVAVTAANYYALVNHTHPGGPGGGGVTVHGELSGLGEDDHQQYVRKDIINAKGDLFAGIANDEAARLAAGSNGQVLKANSSTTTGLQWADETGGGGGSSLLDSAYVDVTDFGAVGDYVVATGVGTDNTTAFNDAVNAASGRTVYVPPGRYKTTGPIVLKQGSHLCGPFEVRQGAIASQGGLYASTIAFHGGATDNAIQAVGTITSASRVMIENLTVHDHRTTKTTVDNGSHGIYFEEVVNQTVIQHCDIRGFTAGCSIKITATAGNSSDCVYIDDIWCLDNRYGVHVGGLDNNNFIRRIYADNNDAVTQAVIRVGGLSGVVLIEGVKHENGGANPTIVLEDNYPSVIIDGVVSRVGTGGPVVRINGTGSGCTIRGVQRQNSGVLLQTVDGVQDKTLSGIRLPFWVGGSDGLAINEARMFGLTTAGTGKDLFIDGYLHASLSGVNDKGQLSIKADSTTRKALTVTAPASYATDYLKVYDSSSVSLLRVDSTGLLLANKGLALTGPFTVNRSAVADANYTVTATDTIVAVTTLTTGRTITLPAPSGGRRLIIKDESGTAATNNITIARATAPAVIDGQTSITIATNYGSVDLYSNGTNWYTDRGRTQDLVPVTAQTGAYTLTLTDLGAAVEVNSATGVAVTVPPNSSVAFPIGTVIEIVQLGAGQVTVTAGAGVTLRTASSLTTRAQYSVVSARKRASDEWVIAGDTT